MTDLREAIVAVIRENLMSTDHPVSEWEEQFADAVLAILPDAEALADALNSALDGLDQDSTPIVRRLARVKIKAALANYRKGTGREG